MGLAAQGRTRFLIRTFGKSWHGQVPILGINAIEKMSKINVALNNYWRNVLLFRQREVPGIDLPSDLKAVGIDKLTAMLNIGTIKGGVQGATVPDKCEEEVLRGMVPGETFKDVQREFISVIEGVKSTDSDLRYEVVVINCREGYIMNPNHEYIQSSKRVVENVLGHNINFSGNLASTDMNYQLNDGKMPCFTLGVGEEYANVHKQNESVAVDDIIKCAEAVTMLCINILSK
jgi:acetylornithine deacetylase/succinyl-diaminopimelate desuccinylase-like protein